MAWNARIFAKRTTHQRQSAVPNFTKIHQYEGWNFNSGNYLFTTDTKQIHVSKFYCPSL